MDEQIQKLQQLLTETNEYIRLASDLLGELEKPSKLAEFIPRHDPAWESKLNKKYNGMV
jgi:hypothetical protein